MKNETKEIQEKMNELEELQLDELTIQTNIQCRSISLTDMLWTLTVRGDMTWSKYQTTDMVDSAWTANYDGAKFVVYNIFTKYDYLFLKMISEDKRFEKLVTIDVLKCPSASKLLTYLYS